MALTEGIRDGIVAQGIPAGKVALITNGVDLDIGTGAAPTRAAPVPDDAFVAMYVGAHGTYSSLETVLDAADRLRDDRDTRVVLVGGGDRKPALVEEAGRRGLANVAFVDPVPKREVPSWLARADACLLPYQDNPLFAGALPNKAFDYLGAARPIIASAPAGELTRMVERAGCGVAVPPEDGAALAGAIRALAADPRGRAADGRAAVAPTPWSTTTGRRWPPASWRWWSPLRADVIEPVGGGAKRAIDLLVAVPLLILHGPGHGRPRRDGAPRLARARPVPPAADRVRGPAVHPPEVPHDGGAGPRAWAPGWRCWPATTASRPWATRCAGCRSTSCPSCGTSSAAT